MAWKRVAATALVLALGTGCASYDRRAGVDNLWRSDAPTSLEKGVTTQAQVMEQFGPPSQVIDLGEGVALYYLRERTRGRIQVYIVYNRQSENITYDRAIFFFDKKGTLTEYAFSQETIPRD